MEARGRYADFPRDEYAARQAKAAGLMEERGLDALLLFHSEHLAYFTGHKAWMPTKTEPFACLLPRDHGPVLLLPAVLAADAEAFSFVDDVRTWRGDCLETYEAALRELGLARGRIGVELSAYLEMPYLTFERLKARLPGVTWIDALDLLWECRKIKSPREIAYLRRAAAATDAAIERAWSVLRPGVSERELAAVIGSALLEHGADQVGALTIRSGRDNERLRLKYASERVIEAGDFVTFDGGCVYRGYYSDVMRSASVGEPDPQLAERYVNALMVNRAVREAIRPGMLIDELDQVRARVIEENGLQPWFPAVGHGIGLAISEPPRIAGGVYEEVRPGMVFALEPGIAYPPMVFNCEDVVLVTADGVECLTTCSRELYVAG